MIDILKVSSDIKNDFTRKRNELKMLGSEGLKSLADFEFQIGNYEKAERCYLQALNNAKGNNHARCSIYYCLARVYNNLRNEVKEIYNIKKAIDLDGDFHV